MTTQRTFLRQLKEIPAHRAIARLLHGPVAPDEHLARVKAEMLPSVNDICRQLECHKRSTARARPIASASAVSAPVPPPLTPSRPFAGDHDASLSLVAALAVPRERPHRARDGRCVLTACGRASSAVPAAHLTTTRGACLQHCRAALPLGGGALEPPSFACSSQAAMHSYAQAHRTCLRCAGAGCEEVHVVAPESLGPPRLPSLNVSSRAC